LGFVKNQAGAQVVAAILDGRVPKFLRAGPSAAIGFFGQGDVFTGKIPLSQPGIEGEAKAILFDLYESLAGSAHQGPLDFGVFCQDVKFFANNLREGILRDLKPSKIVGLYCVVKEKSKDGATRADALRLVSNWLQGELRFIGTNGIELRIFKSLRQNLPQRR